MIVDKRYAFNVEIIFMAENHVSNRLINNLMIGSIKIMSDIVLDVKLGLKKMKAAII